jgi:hypothetical protein
MATGVEQPATMDVGTFKGLLVINGGVGEVTANASIAAIQPMSALPPKADMCSAPTHVCFVSKRDRLPCLPEQGVTVAL